MPKINIIQLGTQGVDMKSSPLLVGTKNRVHSATNLVFDEGVVRTRPGFVYTTTEAVGQFNGAASFRPRKGISSAPLSQALSGIAVVVDGVPILGCHPLGDTFGCCGDVHIFQAENYLIFQSPECDTFWWDGMTLTRSPGMNEVDWVEDELPFKELEHEVPVANIPDCESLGNETEVVVTFTVLDNVTSEPVEGAIITVFHNTHKAFLGVTGEDGKWVFHPTPREYQFTVTRNGYIPQEDGSFIVNAEASERIWDVCAPPQILINGETNVLVRLAPAETCFSLEQTNVSENVVILSFTNASEESREIYSITSEVDLTLDISLPVVIVAGDSVDIQVTGASSLDGVTFTVVTECVDSGLVDVPFATGCACLVDPLFEFGDDAYTIGRTYRTESVLDFDASVTGLENDDHWVLVPNGATLGSVEFNVCRASEVTLRLYFEPSANAQFAQIYLRGDLTHDVTILAGAGESHDYVLILSDEFCENSINVVGATGGDTDQILLEVIEVI